MNSATAGGTRLLADGNQVPVLGLGVWQVPDGRECVNAVRWALEAGYRHIDTAEAYGNCAICPIVWGVAPVERPTPALSKVTTRRFVARASISAGSQLSRLPQKCWSRTSGTSLSPVSR